MAAGSHHRSRCTASGGVQGSAWSTRPIAVHLLSLRKCILAHTIGLMEALDASLSWRVLRTS